MKELSIEEKAKAYDEAIEKFAVILNLNTVKESGTIFADDVRKIFPELKESEDEKTKKDLIKFVKERLAGFPDCGRFVDWLEKQGEKKCTYQLNNLKSNIKFPFKAKVKSSGIIVTICGGQLSPDGEKWIKYQSDQKDGYKVYEPDCLELVCEDEEKSANKVEQSEQEWSKEDSPYFDDICEILINLLHSKTADVNKDAIQKDLDWLKSLRPKNTWKPSDEQMDALSKAIAFVFDSNSDVKHTLESLYSELKKL